jgi:aryl-alcohol dehydrogenase-like predicted oxidoreductase
MPTTVLRSLGPTPNLGLGCLSISGYYGECSVADGMALIDLAVDLGIRLFDTSDSYGPYTNEVILGQAVAGRRQSVLLATKFGNLYGRDGQWLGVSGDPDYVPLACEASLRRLGTDYIDLYYLHRADTSTPIEETVGAMARLVESGKVRAIGLSEASPEAVLKANGVHPLTAVQTEYSLFSREVEEGLLPVLREAGAALVAYAPLGRGLLSASVPPTALEVGDVRARYPRFRAENLRRNQELLAPLNDIARQRATTTGAVALAWLLGKGDGVLAIPGTRSRDHLRENVDAADFTLTAAELARLDAAYRPGVAFGDRYSDMEGLR